MYIIIYQVIVTNHIYIYIYIWREGERERERERYKCPTRTYCSKTITCRLCIQEDMNGNSTITIYLQDSSRRMASYSNPPTSILNTESIVAILKRSTKRVLHLLIIISKQTCVWGGNIACMMTSLGP